MDHAKDSNFSWRPTNDKIAWAKCSLFFRNTCVDSIRPALACPTADFSMNEPTADDLKLVAYPGFGYRTRRGKWCIRISGCVYDYGGEISIRKRLLLKMLTKVMKASPHELDSENFRRRIAPFIVRAGHGHRITIRLGERDYGLRRRSRRSGSFRGRIVLASDAIDGLGSDSAGVSLLQATVRLDDRPDRRADAPVLFFPPQGVSIVSDIDDTIKVTQIDNRRELLANTFLREFRAVPGMADVYQRWSRQGAVFHYVSSSPWQLYEPLVDFQEFGGFPPGTVDLRTFRFRDQFVRRRTKARKRKSRSIRLLMQAYPQRRYVLIGDSGERDPEIYTLLARRYPQQVAAILIRELPHRPMRGKRQQLLQEIDNVQIFSSAEELSDSIDDWSAHRV
jgi:hypothetical protein